VTVEATVRKEVGVIGSGVPNGRFPLTNGMKLLDLLALVQALSKESNKADLQKISIIRGTQVLTVNAEKASKGEDLSQNIELQGGDIIRIDTKEPEQKMMQVMILGEVRTAGPRSLEGGTRFRTALLLVGGISPTTADTKNITVKHKDGTVTKIDFEKAMDDVPEANLELKDGDEIVVPQKVREEMFFTIQGPLGKQGPIPMTESSMKLTEAIAMAGPPPGAKLKGASIRRKGPDGKPQLIVVNLDNIYQAKQEDVSVLPGDFVLVEQRAPKRNIFQDILRPLSTVASTLFWLGRF